MEHADFIDRLVATGAYASGSEVVRAGLRALQERDAAVERWLAAEVATAFDLTKADPSRTCQASEVFNSVRALHAKRLTSGT